jgi:hypothetical protein
MLAWRRFSTCNYLSMARQVAGLFACISAAHSRVAPNSAKNQTQREQAIPGGNPWWLWPGVCRPEPVVRRANWSGGSRLNNFVRSELPSMRRRRTPATAPMTVQPASHPSIVATQSPSMAPAESIQATGPNRASRANAVHAAKAKITRRNSLRVQRLLQKRSGL